MTGLSDTTYVATKVMTIKPDIKLSQSTLRYNYKYDHNQQIVTNEIPYSVGNPEPCVYSIIMTMRIISGFNIIHPRPHKKLFHKMNSKYALTIG